MNEIVKQIYQGIIDGQQNEVAAGVDAALQAGVPARTILEEGTLAAMAEVGLLFEEGECYVPEKLISYRAMKTGPAKLQHSFVQTDVKAAGTVALGTVKGDLHNMGKNLVGMMLEGAGYKVKDLGVDVAPKTFVLAADDVDVIGLSALLTTTMDSMKTTLEALDAAGKRSKEKSDRGRRACNRGFCPPDRRGWLCIRCEQGSCSHKVHDLLHGLKQLRIRI